MAENEMGAGTQCYLILEWMKTVGPITARDAMERLGCYRLAARIADLRKAGYPIKSEMKTRVSARTGYKSRYAEYSLEENQC